MGNVFNSKKQYMYEEKEPLIDKECKNIGYSDHDVDTYTRWKINFYNCMRDEHLLCNKNEELYYRFSGCYVPKIVDGRLITSDNCKGILKWLICTKFSVIKNFNFDCSWDANIFSEVILMSIHVAEFKGIVIYNEFSQLSVYIPFSTIEKIKKFIDIFIAKGNNKSIIKVNTSNLLLLEYNWNSVEVTVEHINGVQNVNNLGVNRIIINSSDCNFSNLKNSNITQLTINVNNESIIDTLLTCKYLDTVRLNIKQELDTDTIINQLCKSKSMKNIYIKQTIAKMDMAKIIEDMFVENNMIQTFRLDASTIICCSENLNEFFNVRDNCSFKIQFDYMVCIPNNNFKTSIKNMRYTGALSDIKPVLSIDIKRLIELCEFLDEHNIILQCKVNILNFDRKLYDVKNILLDFVHNNSIIQFLLMTNIFKLVPESERSIMEILTRRNKYNKSMHDLCK